MADLPILTYEIFAFRVRSLRDNCFDNYVYNFNDENRENFNAWLNRARVLNLYNSSLLFDDGNYIGNINRVFTELRSMLRVLEQRNDELDYFDIELGFEQGFREEDNRRQLQLLSSGVMDRIGSQIERARIVDAIRTMRVRQVHDSSDEIRRNVYAPSEVLERIRRFL